MRTPITLDDLMDDLKPGMSKEEMRVVIKDFLAQKVQVIEKKGWKYVWLKMCPEDTERFGK